MKDRSPYARADTSAHIGARTPKGPSAEPAPVAARTEIHRFVETLSSLAGPSLTRPLGTTARDGPARLRPKPRSAAP